MWPFQTLWLQIWIRACFLNGRRIIDNCMCSRLFCLPRPVKIKSFALISERPSALHAIEVNTSCSATYRLWLSWHDDQRADLSRWQDSRSRGCPWDCNTPLPHVPEGTGQPPQDRNSAPNVQGCQGLETLVCCLRFLNDFLNLSRFPFWSQNPHELFQKD